MKIGGITRSARHELEGGTREQLGKLMDQNHALLQEMTVSSPELDRLVETARPRGRSRREAQRRRARWEHDRLGPRRQSRTSVASALISAGSPRVIITALESSAR